jgi:transcriptional regulator with XRE-family HTH domain
VATPVGKRIQRLRETRGISQRALAEATGRSNAGLSRVESGERNPSWDFLVAIADELGTTALYLRSGKRGQRCPVCGRGGA